MVGYLELLKKEQLSPAARDYADVISDKAEKLKTMIESLFFWQRPAAETYL